MKPGQGVSLSLQMGTLAFIVDIHMCLHQEHLPREDPLRGVR